MDFFKQIFNRIKQFQHTRAFFWISLIFLNELILLPTIVFNSGSFQIIPAPPMNAPRGWYDTVTFFLRRENQDLFRIAVDYYIILTLLFITAKSRYYRIIRTILLPVYLVILIFHIYDASMYFTFGAHPILYNDLLQLLDAFYLMVDFSFTKFFFIISGVLVAGTMLFLIIPYLFKTVALGLKKRKTSRNIMIFGIAGWVLIFSLTYWFRFQEYRSISRWIFPKLIKNVEESLRVKNFLKNFEENPLDSTYFNYDKITLNMKPDIYVFMVESYGKVILENEKTQNHYFKYINTWDTLLKKEGWFSASIFSKAPIIGGRSWLSIITLLSGIRIQDQAVYTYIINRLQDFPHLIRYLNSQGYHTMSLQPLNRSRPGYTLTNYEKFYNYKQYINFAELNFDGPKFGFRNVPDQYSLNFAHEKYVRHTSSPLFLFFITVSSHAPWIDLPPYVVDSLRLVQKAYRGFAADASDVLDKVQTTYSYRSEAGFDPYNYFEHTKYELHVLLTYILENTSDNSIFIMAGDHQPPLLTTVEDGFYTPLHVISKDSLFISALYQFGFSEGLILQPDSESTINLEGFYSLLIRCLCKQYSDTPADSLPQYFPEGISLTTSDN